MKRREKIIQIIEELNDYLTDIFDISLFEDVENNLEEILGNIQTYFYDSYKSQNYRDILNALFFTYDIHITEEIFENIYPKIENSLNKIFTYLNKV